MNLIHISRSVHIYVIRISMLELRHLRTLMALQETGSVSRAAKRVHLTQSALSHQLKTLQDHYGLSIVQRRGQSVELTDAGKHLVILAEKVLEEIQATERGLRVIRADLGEFAYRTRMPHLFRLADAAHGCVPPALAGC